MLTRAIEADPQEDRYWRAVRTCSDRSALDKDTLLKHLDDMMRSPLKMRRQSLISPFTFSLSQDSFNSPRKTYRSANVPLRSSRNHPFSSSSNDTYSPPRQRHQPPRYSTLLDPETFEISRKFYQELCEKLVYFGHKWGLVVRPAYFDSVAGRMLVAMSAMHAHCQRGHRGRQGPSEARVLREEAEVLSAFFWAPLVHRAGSKEAWALFYRRQGALNTVSMIKAGFAKSLVKEPRLRYNFNDISFLNDQQLEGMYSEWRDCSRLGSAERILQLLSIDPRDHRRFHIMH